MDSSICIIQLVHPEVGEKAMMLNADPSKDCPQIRHADLTA
jgi:hypothetical protein